MGLVVLQVGSMGICLIKVCSSKCIVVKGKYYMYMNMQIYYNMQLVDIYLRKFKKNVEKKLKKKSNFISVLFFLCGYIV